MKGVAGRCAYVQSCRVTPSVYTSPEAPFLHEADELHTCRGVAGARRIANFGLVSVLPKPCFLADG